MNLLERIKSELFRDDSVVYIPFRELLIEFKPRHFDETVDELLSCGGFDENSLLNLSSGLRYDYNSLKRRARTELDFQTKCHLHDFIRDVMNVFVASYVINDEKPKYVPETIRKLFITKEILSLSRVNAPDFKLDKYFRYTIKR